MEKKKKIYIYIYIYIYNYKFKIDPESVWQLAGVIVGVCKQTKIKETPLKLVFSGSLNITFLLIFFLGNFLRNTSAKVPSSIPDHGWVPPPPPPPPPFFLSLSFLFPNGNSMDLEVNILSHY